MKKCRNCDNEIPTWIEICGKTRNLSKRKFCLQCSPFGSHNTKKDVNSKTKRVNKHKFICKVCNKERFETGTNLECNVCRTKKIRKLKKQKAIEYAGGKCYVCDYNRCQDALDFHHLDANKKSFNLSHHWNWSWDRLKPEIDKCILICCRCHREIESGLIQLK